MSEYQPRTLPAGIEIYSPTSDEDFVAMAELRRATVLDDTKKRSVPWYDLLPQHDSEWVKVQSGYYRARAERVGDQYSTRLARIGEAVIGMCHAQDIGGVHTRYEILEHGVDPEYQGQGVGTTLLVASLDRAPSDAIVQLRVAAASPAAAHYRGCGFLIDDERNGRALHYSRDRKEYSDSFEFLTTTAGALAEHALRAVDLGAIRATKD